MPIQQLGKCIGMRAKQFGHNHQIPMGIQQFFGNLASGKKEHFYLKLKIEWQKN
jgi:hypothetical protein